MADLSTVDGVNESLDDIQLVDCREQYEWDAGRIPGAHHLPQREVAERMTARPPEMSILAVAVQFYGRAKVQFRIGGGAFIPRPRVESAVVRIDLYDETRLPRDDHPLFFKLVRAGFAQRRKRLDNSIGSALGIKKSVVADSINEAGIEPSRRAETLDVEDWVRLFGSCRELLVG
jgi:16S rRNA (adenine1518-N6/adenine1519-N6)-dimethyltransferase